MATTEVTQASSDIIWDISGTGSSVSTPVFTANKYKGLSYYLSFGAGINSPVFAITLVGMGANTFGRGRHQLTGIDTLQTAQPDWGETLSDTGPFTVVGTLWLPPAPFEKRHDCSIWSVGAAWTRTDKNNDTAHDPTQVVWGLGASTTYRLLVTAVT